MFESLYEEFGREEVGRVRRELTTKLNRIPSYIELLAELCLRQGPSTPPLESTPLTPEELIKRCDEQIGTGCVCPKIVLRMPGKWGKTDTRRLGLGGPVGQIVSDIFDGQGIIVMFDAREVKQFLSKQSDPLKHEEEKDENPETAG